jgi:hypothetical protein
LLPSLGPTRAGAGYRSSWEKAIAVAVGVGCGVSVGSGGTGEGWTVPVGAGGLVVEQGQQAKT